MTDRRDYLPFISIIIAFFIVRLSILFLAMDKLIYTEEGARALIAKQLISGPLVPFFDLQVDSYSGGSLVVGLLMAPLFKLLGQNLISVKLVAVLFSFATVVALYLFCKRFFNRRVAIIASLLFILSPPFFTKYSLITMGFHTESILFSILLIFIFFEIFFNNKKNAFHFIILGLIGGFGLWFTYIFSITLFTCVLFWFLLDRGFFLRKNFFVFLFSFICGFSPWIYYNLSHGFKGLHLGKRELLPSFSTEHLIFSLAKLKNLFLCDIKNSFFFENLTPLDSDYLSSFYYLIFILSFVVLFWFNRRSLYSLIRRFIPARRFQITNIHTLKESFFLICVAIFSLIFSLSNFQVNTKIGFVGYRYLFPLYPFIFILIALFINKIQERKQKGYAFVSGFTLIILLSIGLANNLKFISFNSTGIRSFDIDYANIDIISLGGKIGWHYGGDMNKCISLINRLEEQYRFSLYEGLGAVIGSRFGNDLDKCIGLINRVEEKYKFPLCRGWGSGIGYRFGNDTYKCIDLINRVEKRYRFHFCEGLGFSIGWQFGNKTNKCIRLINRVGERYRFPLCRGVGCGLGSRFWNNIDKCISVINRIEERYRFSLYLGLGIDMGLKNGSGIDKCTSLINRIEEKYRFDLYRELGYRIGWRFGSDIDKCIRLINQVEERYKISLYEGLGRVIGWRFGSDADKYISLINQVEERYKISLYEGIGKVISWRFESDLDKHISLIQRVEEKYKPYLYRGLGKKFINGFTRGRYNIDTCIGFINRVEEKYRCDLYEELGSVIGRRFGSDVDKYTSLIQRVEERYRTNVYRGILFVFNWNSYKGDIDTCISLIQRVEEKHRPCFYISLGTYFIRGVIKDRYTIDKCTSLVTQVEGRYRTYVYEGLGEGVASAEQWRTNGFVAHYISLLSWKEEEYKKAFHKGLGKGFYWQHISDFGADRQRTIIEKVVEDKYIPYVYEGIKNPF